MPWNGTSTPRQVGAMRRQMTGQERRTVAIDSEAAEWSALYNFWPMRLARLYSLVRFSTV